MGRSRSRSRSRSRDRDRKDRDRDRDRRRHHDEEDGRHSSHHAKHDDRKRKRSPSPGGDGRKKHQAEASPAQNGGGTNGNAAPASRPTTETEESEAERIARIAARAEAKAAARANGGASAATSSSVKQAAGAAGEEKVTFLTKKEREALALKRLQEKRGGGGGGSGSGGMAAPKPAVPSSFSKAMAPPSSSSSRDTDREREREARHGAREQREKEKELQAIRDAYLGKKENKKRVVKPSEKFANIFKFDWDAKEDTSRDTNPLYAQRLEVIPLFGRGYVAGVDMVEQRKHNHKFLEALAQKRTGEEDQIDLEGMKSRTTDTYGRRDDRSVDLRWPEKKLEDMTERDWRIFREDFDISTRGAKGTMPLRYWNEGGLPKEVLRALDDLGYKDPTPIQRAALPLGMERRDLIGIAETGSGKTIAFAIPIIQYVLGLPKEYRERCNEQGPLALVMAPTRELAQQIDEEIQKLLVHTQIKTACGVGGQPIEDQGLALRKGVEILIGTPGRLEDLIESRYLVLNQCNYIVLDEADRMVDMGFEPQVTAVLEAMGGLLKSEDEEEAHRQAEQAKTGVALYRVTAMFSATMPPAVERIARSYLRHPATVKIGDERTGKNKRITQNVRWCTEPQKKSMVLDILRHGGAEDKYIVFVNAKKNCDIMARHLEGASIHCGILHGGKTQDSREASLESFRTGEFKVLVATDVAGRGLDIPDVTHVINYDMPDKIDKYCHRIGRTGRAGKEGVATTFLTEHDEGVFFDLKQYLESTESVVPQQLAKHPAATTAPGARAEDGKLLSEKRRR